MPTPTDKKALQAKINDFSKNNFDKSAKSFLIKTLSLKKRPNLLESAVRAANNITENRKGKRVTKKDLVKAINIKDVLLPLRDKNAPNGRKASKGSKKTKGAKSATKKRKKAKYSAPCCKICK